MRIVAKYTEFQPTFITLDTNGGNVVAAIKFGRAIQALSANTLQMRMAQCLACALTFVGGVRSSAEAGLSACTKRRSRTTPPRTTRPQFRRFR
jgi:hypothetical protein